MCPAFLLCSFAVCNINIASDIAGEFSSGGVPRNTALIDPTIFAIRSPEPVLHSERLSRMECRQEAIQAALHIVWMHAFDPARAHLLVHRSASELQPRFVEIVTKGVRSRCPDHDRCGIGDRLKPNLALEKPFFSALPFSDVAIDRVIRNSLAGSRNYWNREERDMNISPILAPTDSFDFYSLTGHESELVLLGAFNQCLGNDEIINGTL